MFISISLLNNLINEAIIAFTSECLFKLRPFESSLVSLRLKVQFLYGPIKLWFPMGDFVNMRGDVKFVLLR
jgi:hypothetical protein